jgi:hypothetical protein
MTSTDHGAGSLRRSERAAPRRIRLPAATSARERIARIAERALRAEAATWMALWRAVAVRPRVPRGASGFGYDRPVRAILIAFLVVSAIEVPVVDLLVHRWPAVRIPLLVLGIWGVATMLGMLLGFATRPHAVGPDGIRVRHGAAVDLDLPWSVIASVAPRRRSLGGAPTWSLTGSDEREVLHHVVQDGTDVDIELEHPVELRLPAGAVRVHEVRISVDDVPGFLAAVRAHIP